MDDLEIRGLLVVIITIIYFIKCLHICYKSITYKITDVEDEKFNFRLLSIIVLILFIFILHTP